VTLFLMIDKSG